MFESVILPFSIYIADGALSGLYGIDLLRSRLPKRTTLLSWFILYFGMDILLFDVFGLDGNVIDILINALGMLVLQTIFFQWDYMRQLFVTFSFLAGKNILKYIISVLYVLLSESTFNIVEQRIATDEQITLIQAKLIVNVQSILLNVVCILVYAVLFRFYLNLIIRTAYYKGYEPGIRENIFLVFPCVTAICISVTLRMLILRIDSVDTAFVYDSVPNVRFWIVLICILLLGTIILTMKLFRYLVEYNEENRKQVILEKQVEQLHREIEDIEGIYSDLRGLKHDMRNHLNNIMHYVNQHEKVNTQEIDGYIGQIEDAVDRLDISSRSGNPITDIIIYQRRQEAKKHNIRFDVDFVYSKESTIDVYDVAVILNNALDNAFEACRELDSEPEISLRSYMKGTLFFIEIKNDYAGGVTLNRETGLPLTKKSNKHLHGIGIENIRKCAEKYMGDIDIELYSDEGRKIFLLTVMLCSRISLQ